MLSSSFPSYLRASSPQEAAGHMLAWASENIKDPVTGHSNWKLVVAHSGIVVGKNGASVIKLSKGTAADERLRVGLETALHYQSSEVSALPPLLDSPLSTPFGVATLWPLVPAADTLSKEETLGAVEKVAFSISAMNNTPNKGHGDLHVGNILLSWSGPWVIDFDRAGSQPAEGDAATLLASLNTIQQHSCVAQDNSSLTVWYNTLFTHFPKKHWAEIFIQKGVPEPNINLMLQQEALLQHSLWSGHRKRECGTIHAQSLQWLLQQMKQEQ